MQHRGSRSHSHLGHPEREGAQDVAAEEDGVCSPQEVAVLEQEEKFGTSGIYGLHVIAVA